MITISRHTPRVGSKFTNYGCAIKRILQLLGAGGADLSGASVACPLAVWVVDSAVLHPGRQKPVIGSTKGRHFLYFWAR